MARFTRHARDQMADRNISEAEVEETLADPQITYPSHQRPDRRVLVRTIGERRIKIVVPIAEPDVIVSAMDQTQEE
jgi:hypothetical protein